MNPFTLQDFRRLNPFPGCRSLDQDPLSINALGLIKAHKAARTGQSRFGIEGQSGIHFTGNSPWDDAENLQAEFHQRAVAKQVEWLCAVLGDRFIQ